MRQFINKFISYFKAFKRIFCGVKNKLSDLNKLAEFLEYDKRLLYLLINNTETFYKSYEIPKRTGGKRAIDVPEQSLMYIQTVILKSILNKFNLLPCCIGFTKGKSIIDNAKMHIESNELLKMDIKNFFPSIKLHQVYDMYRKMSYTKRMSYILAKLCCFNNCLPQGAPTSPMISNIIASNMDKRLNAICNKYNLIYSRYADDISISGDRLSKSLIEIVKDIARDEGFIINEAKTHLYKTKAKKIVTGISISTGELKIPRKMAREIKQEVYYISKYGIINHMDKTNNMYPTYIDRVRGRINFWLQVEPNNSHALKALNIILEEDKRIKEIVYANNNVVDSKKTFVCNEVKE